MYTITHGIGDFSDIPHFILRGLSPAPAPSDPASELGLANLAETVTLLSSQLSETGTASEVVALPGLATQITWQTIYGSAPATAEVEFQVSLDGVNFSAGDETTSVDGEIRTFITSARFARAFFGAGMEDGIATTVNFVAKAIGYYPLP